MDAGGVFSYFPVSSDGIWMSLILVAKVFFPPTILVLYNRKLLVTPAIN